MPNKTALLNRPAFLQSGNQLLATMRARRRRVTLVLVEADELRDIEVLHGPAAGLAMRHALAARLLAITGQLGIAGQTGEYEFTLLLPVVDEEFAWRLVARELGDPAEVRVPLRAGTGRRRQAVMRPTCLLRATGPGERSLEACHAALRGELAELKWHATDPGFENTQPWDRDEEQAAPHVANAPRFSLPEWRRRLALAPRGMPVPLGYL